MGMNVFRFLGFSAAICSFSLLGLVTMSTSAQAGDVKIIQKNKSFGMKKLTVKVGDTLLFVNEDKVSHNMISKSKGHEFEIKIQKPGTTEKKKVTSAGKFKVKCAIHPKMKLKITAE